MTLCVHVGGTLVAYLERDESRSTVQVRRYASSEAANIFKALLQGRSRSILHSFVRHFFCHARLLGHCWLVATWPHPKRIHDLLNNCMIEQLP